MSIWLLAALVSLFVPRADEPKNPWREKTPAALASLIGTPNAAVVRDALEVLRRADAWADAAQVADAALKQFPQDASLYGPIARALLRAGRLEDGERVALLIKPETDDREALAVLIGVLVARGEVEKALPAAARLEKLGPTSANQYNAILTTRIRANQLDGLGRLVRATSKALDPDGGYPDNLMGESIEGLAEFYEKIDAKPVNQLARPGSAPMPLLTMIQLPYVEAYVNGQGPHRLIVDTGGSFCLSLDAEVAEEMGIKSLASAPIRGVSGKQDSGQALVDELTIGDVRMKRVLTRTIEFPAMLKTSCSGILGTGMFDGGRMTLDFQNARFVIEPSSDKPAAGAQQVIRIIGDGKFLAPIRVQDQSAMAILDTGASTGAFSLATLKRLFPEHSGREFGAAGLGVGQGAEAKINLAPMVKLEVFGRTKEKYSGVGLDVLDNALSPIIGVQCDFLFGMPLFREMKSFTVDFPRTRMWVEWGAP
jgi:predicted aspartyl protease